jgi:preprotein translocase subunit SecD
VTRLRILVPLALAVAVAIIVALFLLLRDGDGDGGSDNLLRIRVQPNVADLPAGSDPAAVTEFIISTYKIRADFYRLNAEFATYDETGIEITIDSLVIPDDARKLFEDRAQVDLRRPIVDESGNITCTAADGSTFFMPPENVTYVAEEPNSPRLPHCQDEAGNLGDIVWTIAVPAVDDVGIASVGGARLEHNPDPIVIATFTSGPNVLEATEPMVGLPMGIFIDGEIVAGPTLKEPVSSGNVVIAGLTLTDAEILTAQLSGGPLPVPVTIVSVEGGTS